MLPDSIELVVKTFTRCGDRVDCSQMDPTMRTMFEDTLFTVSQQDAVCREINLQPDSENRFVFMEAQSPEKYKSQAVHEHFSVYVLDQTMATLGYSLRRKVPKPEDGNIELHFEMTVKGAEPPAKKRKLLSTGEPQELHRGPIEFNTKKQVYTVCCEDDTIMLIPKDSVEYWVGHGEGLVDIHLKSGKVVQVRTPERGELVVSCIYSMAAPSGPSA